MFYLQLSFHNWFHTFDYVTLATEKKCDIQKHETTQLYLELQLGNAHMECSLRMSWFYATYLWKKCQIRTWIVHGILLP